MPERGSADHERCTPYPVAPTLCTPPAPRTHRAGYPESPARYLLGTCERRTRAGRVDAAAGAGGGAWRSAAQRDAASRAAGAARRPAQPARRRQVPAQARLAWRRSPWWRPRSHGAAGLFLVPMRAIAGEKQADWQRFAAQGLRVYKTTGDDAAYDPAAGRGGPDRGDHPGAAGEPDPQPAARRPGGAAAGGGGRTRCIWSARGDAALVLEALLTRLGAMMPQARLIAHVRHGAQYRSAGRWLDADVFTSDWRPMQIESAHPRLQAAARPRVTTRRSATPSPRWP